MLQAGEPPERGCGDSYSHSQRGICLRPQTLRLFGLVQGRDWEMRWWRSFVSAPSGRLRPCLEQSPSYQLLPRPWSGCW